MELKRQVGVRFENDIFQIAVWIGDKKTGMWAKIDWSYSSEKEAKYTLEWIKKQKGFQKKRYQITKETKTHIIWRNE